MRQVSVAALREYFPKKLQFEVDEWQRKTEPSSNCWVATGIVLPTVNVSVPKGPSATVIDGSLTCNHAQFETDDYAPGLVLVSGDLRARSLSFANGARVFVTGTVEVETFIFGQHGDRDGVLSARNVSAQAVLLDRFSSIWAEKELSAYLFGALGWYEKLVPDFVNSGEGEDDTIFVDEVLDPKMKNAKYLDFDRAIAATRQGKPVFKPGVLPKKVMKPRRTK